LAVCKVTDSQQVGTIRRSLPYPAREADETAGVEVGDVGLSIATTTVTYTGHFAHD